MYPLQNVKIEVGDHVKVRVFGSDPVRGPDGTVIDDAPVKLGLSTYEEMCINSLYARVSRDEIEDLAHAQAFGCAQGEESLIWMGGLDQDDNIIADAKQVWEKHSAEAARGKKMLYASTPDGQAISLDDQGSLCERCHDEQRDRVWGVHCWVSEDHARRVDMVGAILSQRPSYTCPQTAPYRSEYTCGQAFEHAIAREHEDSSSCRAYHHDCCGEPICGAGTVWNPDRRVCQANYVKVMEACREGRSEFGFACENQKEMPCDQGQGEGEHRASEKQCFDCRFCFDCGRYGTCDLPMKKSAGVKALTHVAKWNGARAAGTTTIASNKLNF